MKQDCMHLGLLTDFFVSTRTLVTAEVTGYSPGFLLWKFLQLTNFDEYFEPHVNLCCENPRNGFSTIRQYLGIF